MQWTDELRYLPYSKWSAAKLLELQHQAANSNYQLKYHIRPTSGLLNDPNGFSYFNDKWHVFYQAYPFGAVHGVKSWVHLQSDDLVHWENIGLAIEPDTIYDSHGAYSGSACQIDDKLFLMYTGNVRDKDWVRHPYQNGAWMDKDNNITKLKEPLFAQSEHTTDHFRDPQLLKIADRYFAILGAQDKETTRGKIAIFSTTDFKNWQDHGYLDVLDLDFGYMIECPNLVFVDDHPVLIFCPQGIAKENLDYQNIYPNAYLVGENIDLENAQFTPSDSKLHNLDEGFDVYASQAFNAPDGKAYMISWVGLPEIAYPTDAENWAHCLSVVKELTYQDGHLLQKPVKTMTSLRHNETTLQGMTEAKRTDLYKPKQNQYEIQLTLAADSNGTLHLAGDDQLEHSLQLHFDTKDGKLCLDRSKLDLIFAEEWGMTRTITLPKHQELQLQILIDHSLCEIFVNGGQKVLTARFFNKPKNTQVSLISEAKMRYTGKCWELFNM